MVQGLNTLRGVNTVSKHGGDGQKHIDNIHLLSCLLAAALSQHPFVLMISQQILKIVKLQVYWGLEPSTMPQIKLWIRLTSASLQ